jgi:hypothetical protein
MWRITSNALLKKEEKVLGGDHVTKRKPPAVTASIMSEPKL